MRYQWFTGACVVVALSAVAPAAAVAAPLGASASTRSAAYKWEMGYLGLSAIDAAETISCLNRDVCSEGNPIWGSHPSTGKIIAAKVGLGLIHFAAFKYIVDRSPKTALRLAEISAGVQGGVVLLNAHFAFR
jgi:hypothetical protein